MSKEALKKHYERKYFHESTAKSIKPIRTTKIPTSRFEAVVRFFPQYFKAGDILEIGAGSGNVAKALLSSEMKIAYYAIGDISLARVEGLRRNLDDRRVKIMEIDAENISQSEYGNYNAVIMVALIEHLIDPLRAMQEIRKILKPGGFVYIVTHQTSPDTHKELNCCSSNSHQQRPKMKDLQHFQASLLTFMMKGIFTILLIVHCR